MEIKKIAAHYRQYLARMIKQSTRADYNKRLEMFVHYSSMQGITAIEDIEFSQFLEWVFIYRGVNDLSHSPYAKLTDFGASAMSIPADDTVTGGYGFKEAYALLIKKIRTAYPDALIICCTLNVFKRVNYSAFPTNNGTNTLPEFNNAIREVADMMGCLVIEFDKDGITFENCYS